MALFGNLECRHIGRGDNRTSIAIEPQFWLVADKVAQGYGMTWREWSAAQISKKPQRVGSANWLRVAILEALLEGNCLG
jgi:predicted DNA-binding ribbon-helix-helix protein